MLHKYSLTKSEHLDQIKSVLPLLEYAFFYGSFYWSTLYVGMSLTVHNNIRATLTNKKN